MQHHMIDRDGVSLHACVDGIADPSAPTIMFANALGTDLHLWDGILPHLPKGLRLVRFDNRGHGKSSVPVGPYTMGALVSDAAAVCDALDVRDAVFVGLSVGGMIAQGLAVKRADVMRGLVLSNTAAKIGNPPLWQDRIDTVLAQGMAPLADGIMGRWFRRDVRETARATPLRQMLLGTDPVGYAGVAAAIAGTDFYTPTNGLRLPTLGIAGSDDGSTPPDLVRETVDLIPGSRFVVLRRAGHLPCVDAPVEYAETLTTFLRAIGHI